VGRSPSFIVAALGLLLAPPVRAEPAPTPASEAPVCGVVARDAPGYRAAVAADPRFKADGGDALRESFSAEDIQAIWTFVKPKHPAYPAAVCQQVVDRDGLLQIERQVRCEASAAACAALTAELDRMDDGSGDGA
jgi:hypothetical protein